MLRSQSRLGSGVWSMRTNNREWFLVLKKAFVSVVQKRYGKEKIKEMEKERKRMQKRLDNIVVNENVLGYEGTIHDAGRWGGMSCQ